MSLSLPNYSPVATNLKTDIFTILTPEKYLLSSSSAVGGRGVVAPVSSPLVLLVERLQEEVQLLRQMKEMLTKDLEESHGGKSAEVLSATELKVQLAQKEQELARAKEALQGACLVKALSLTLTEDHQEVLQTPPGLVHLITHQLPLTVTPATSPGRCCGAAQHYQSNVIPEGPLLHRGDGEKAVLEWLAFGVHTPI
ncbi:UNVERIFIED_CONTAM: hypothetical protein FKN15_001979 [Acipenser sinensis]